jgi:DNA transformation protein
MSTSASTMDYLIDQLRAAGPVSCRRMFGEYCLYFDARPVGLVCDDQLYLKPTPIGRSLMREEREGFPFPGATAHLLITADDWDDRQWLCQLVRATFEGLPPPKPKKPRAAPAKAGKTIASLANLGPKSAEMLQAAGISTVAQLRKLGAVEAYVRVKKKSPRASLNLLWALEGAISNLPWQDVARDHRTSLLLALEQRQR